jgi:DNA adenine methylase
LIPKFSGTYYEPFLGTGAVYLHLLPPKAVLNDLNEDIINIWKLVKTNPTYIISEIDKFKKVFLPKTNEDKLKYCKALLTKMENMSGDKRTILYLLLIYCSFTSIINYRFSSILTVIKEKNHCHIFTQNYRDKIIQLNKILKNIKIENKDYCKILQHTKRGDFVFLDPPYIEDKMYDFNYNKDEKFSIETLKKQIEILDSKNVKWMMTQIDTPQIRNIFKEYKIKRYTNDLSIGNKSVDKKEIIITNY